MWRFLNWRGLQDEYFSWTFSQTEISSWKHRWFNDHIQQLYVAFAILAEGWERREYLQILGVNFLPPPPLPWQKLTFYPSSSMYSLDLAAGLSGTHQHCEYLSRWWTFIIDAVQWVPFLLPVTDPGLSIGDVRFTWSDLMITTWSLAIYSLELGWRRNGCHSLIGSIFLHVTMGKRIGSAIQLKPLFCQCFRCRSFWLTAFALGSVYAYTWIALACR